MLQQRHGRRASGKSIGPKRTALIEKIAGIMRAAEPTPFAAEGPCRAGIRAGLCLEGWRWSRADIEAADIVAAALRQVGAVRPTWQQGQPEHTQPGALPILRQTCARCAKPLPEGHYKFCGDICAKAYRSLRNFECIEEKRAKWAATAAARRVAFSETHPKRECETCGGSYAPKEEKQRFCSVRCAQKAVHGPLCL